MPFPHKNIHNNISEWGSSASVRQDERRASRSDVH